MPASPERFTSIARALSATAVALLFLASPALAADATAANSRLTLQEAIDRAIERVPAVASAVRTLDATQNDTGEAKAALRPRVWVAANGVENDKPTIASPFHGFGPGITPEFDRTLLQTGINAEYPIYDGGATPARLRQASHAIAAAGHALTATREEIAAETATVYLSILSQSKMLEAHDKRLDALHAELGRVQDLYRVGRAADVELFRAQAALTAAEAQRTDLASRLDTSERTLARLLGTDPATTRAARLADVALMDEKAPDRETTIKKADKASPRLEQAAEHAGALGASIGLARSAYFPKVKLFAAVNNYRTLDKEFETDWQAGVQLRVPLWDSGATAARVARARSAAAAASDDVRQARLDVENAVDDRIASIERSRAKVLSLGVAVRSYEEVARIEKLRLDNGVGTQTDYLKAEADLMQTRASLAAARYQQIISRIDLARITGELDDAWIDQQVRNTP